MHSRRPRRRWLMPHGKIVIRNPATGRGLRGFLGDLRWTVRERGTGNGVRRSGGVSGDVGQGEDRTPMSAPALHHGRDATSGADREGGGKVSRPHRDRAGHGGVCRFTDHVGKVWTVRRAESRAGSAGSWSSLGATVSPVWVSCAAILQDETSFKGPLDIVRCPSLVFEM